MKKGAVLVICIIAVFLLPVNFVCPQETQEQRIPLKARGILGPTPMPDFYSMVTKNTDGDTIRTTYYTDESIGVRFKGIDAPELARDGHPAQYWAKEAAAYVEEILPPGTKIRLVFRDEVIDSFGRFLAYVYYKKGDDWIYLQEELLKNGMAFVYWKDSYEYPIEFLEFQQEAIDKKRGMWAYREKIQNEVVTTEEELYQKASWYRTRVRVNQ